MHYYDHSSLQKMLFKFRPINRNKQMHSTVSEVWQE
jgi:hypothetical protein